MVESLKSDFAKQEQQRKIEKLQEKQASLIKMHKDSQDKNKLINDKADSYLNKLRRISIVSLILYAVIIILLIVCISWDKMEPITFILSFVLAIALEVYNFIKFDSFNPIDVMNKMRNNKYELLCKEYDFNQNEIEDYKKDIDLVSAQLKDLEGVE